MTYRLKHLVMLCLLPLIINAGTTTAQGKQYKPGTHYEVLEQGASSGMILCLHGSLFH